MWAQTSRWHLLIFSTLVTRVSVQMTEILYLEPQTRDSSHSCKLSSLPTCLCAFKLQVESCLTPPAPTTTFLPVSCVLNCNGRSIFFISLFLSASEVVRSELWRNFPCSESDGTEEQLHQVSTLQQLSGRFLPLGDCMYLTIVSMARPSSTSPPPPPLLLFSFPRIHLTCLSLNLPLLPAVIMMIGSGPAAICSPPSFLTNHYLHFHYSYCRAHMQ